MFIKKINLINFKNYSEIDLQFSSQINLFTGENGSGKTNLLDAIYTLSLTKSAFNSSESYSIKHNAAFFSVLGEFEKNNTSYLVQYDLVGQKKGFKCNKTTYEKLSDHIGQFPVVLITPFDTDIIREGSESRRKFFDGIISQIDNHYLQNLLHYNYFLKNRNSLLKQHAETGSIDEHLLEHYDSELIKLSLHVNKKRKEFLNFFTPIFVKHYENLCEEKEVAQLVYESDANDTSFEAKYRSSYKRDLILQRTSKGVHKDDYIFKLDEYPLKNFGSQGQQKSFVIALKLAQFDCMYKAKEIKPLLLLDDIFDKLDDNRIQKLVEMVAQETFGQLFITDARPERTKQIVAQLPGEIRIFQIANGLVVKESTTI